MFTCVYQCLREVRLPHGYRLEEHPKDRSTSTTGGCMRMHGHAQRSSPGLVTGDRQRSIPPQTRLWARQSLGNLAGFFDHRFDGGNRRFTARLVRALVRCVPTHVKLFPGLEHLGIDFHRFLYRLKRTCFRSGLSREAQRRATSRSDRGQVGAVPLLRASHRGAGRGNAIPALGAPPVRTAKPDGTP